MFNRCTIIELLYNTTVGTQEFELWQKHFESEYSQQLCMLTTSLVALTTGKHFCSAERDVPSCPIPDLVTSLMRISLVPSPTLESGSGSPYIRSWVSVASYYITKRIVSTWPFV